MILKQSKDIWNSAKTLIWGEHCPQDSISKNERNTAWFALKKRPLMSHVLGGSSQDL